MPLPEAMRGLQLDQHDEKEKREEEGEKEGIFPPNVTSYLIYIFHVGINSLSSFPSSLIPSLFFSPFLLPLFLLRKSLFAVIKVSSERMQS